jgi:hypothetical protein
MPKESLLLSKRQSKESGRELGREEKDRRVAVFLTPSHPLRNQQKKKRLAYTEKHRQARKLWHIALKGAYPK